MHPDGVAEIVHAVVPDMLQKLLLTDGPPPVEQQVFQNAGLLSRQGQRLAGGGGGAGAGVEGQGPAVEHHVVLGELPEGQAADAGLQFL